MSVSAAKQESAQSRWPLEEWLRWQETLNPRTIDLGLERARAVAERLNLPSPGIRTLTVGGTNGKGSTATLAAQIFRQAGYRVGLYTSPHLLKYNERIALDGADASDDDLCRAFVAIEQARREVPLTYFEFGTLAALWLFREARVDLQVLEVGLGGRLDAVNVVDADCAIVTNIGLDHTDWLGPDRDSIGREKAGILRQGRDAVIVDRHPPQALLDEARRTGSQVLRLGRDFDFAPRSGGWCWHGPGGRLDDLPLPGLPGSIQLQNAAGVLAALGGLAAQLPVEESAIRAALPKLELRGRLQRIGNVLLDVAHNVEAAEVLADHVRALRGKGDVYLVLGMLSDKPVEGVGRVLEPLMRHAFLAGLPGPRGLSAPDLATRLRAGSLEVELCADVAAALERARAQATDDDLVVVTGSFLTVAGALEALDG
jgi:dihydrofolate synthase/folylpolyglutamate synthase